MTYLQSTGRGESGITLVELLVVLTIVVVLMVALGFQYSGWQGKYNVESQVKGLYSDLVSARARAMQTAVTVSATFPDSTHYSITQNKPVSNAMSASSEDDSTSPATITARDITTVVISFDKKGLIACPVLLTAATQPKGVISFTSTVHPDYDCIVLSQTMIGMGKKVCLNSPDLTNPVACDSDADCPSGTAGSCSLCQEK